MIDKKILKILESERELVSLDCTCSDCRKNKRRIVKAILALIASEQQPMVEALQGLIDVLTIKEKPEPTVIEMEKFRLATQKALWIVCRHKAIDAALAKGEGK